MKCLGFRDRGSHVAVYVSGTEGGILGFELRRSDHGFRSERLRAKRQLGWHLWCEDLKLLAKL